MSKSNTFENLWLRHVFLNEAIPGIGDAGGLRGSVVAGNVYCTLHVADPGEPGTAATDELAYDQYQRQPVPRGAAGFTVTGSVAKLVPNVDFPKMTSGSGGVVTHFAYVAESAGAAMILYRGALDNSLTISNGVTPRIEGQAVGADTTVTED